MEINGQVLHVNREPYLDIVLTDRCNRRCQFCIADLLEKKESCDVEVFKDQILHAVENFGVREVLIVGGEPTIAKGLFPILEFLRDIPEIKKVCITTNGDMLKEESFRRRLAPLVTHLNLSLMHTDIQRQAKIAQKSTTVSLDDLRGICLDPVMSNVELRINCNVFRGNNDSVSNMVTFYHQVKELCNSVKFSPLLRVDDFSVVNQVTEFVKENILFPEEYESLFKGLEEVFDAQPIVRNPHTFGFVEYSMICMQTPIILNYNHRGQMAQQARKGYVNNLKLLTNGNLSLSWNKEDTSRVVRFAQ